MKVLIPDEETLNAYFSFRYSNFSHSELLNCQYILLLSNIFTLFIMNYLMNTTFTYIDHWCINWKCYAQCTPQFTTDLTYGCRWEEWDDAWKSWFWSTSWFLLFTLSGHPTYVHPTLLVHPLAMSVQAIGYISTWKHLFIYYHLKRKSISNGSVTFGIIPNDMLKFYPIYKHTQNSTFETIL